MNLIITHNGKPIFSSVEEDPSIDFLKIAEAVDKSITFKTHYDEWRMHGTINGLKLNKFLQDNNVEVWKYNPISLDWMEVTHYYLIN